MQERMRELFSRYGREVFLVAAVAGRRTGRCPSEATAEAFAALAPALAAADVDDRQLRRRLLVHVSRAA